MQVSSIKNNYNNQNYNYSPKFGGKIAYTPEIQRAFDLAEVHLEKDFNPKCFYLRELVTPVLRFIDGIKYLLDASPDKKIMFEHSVKRDIKPFNSYWRGRIYLSADVDITAPSGRNCSTRTFAQESKTNTPISLMKEAYFNCIRNFASDYRVGKELDTLVDAESVLKLKTKKQEELAELRQKIIEQNRTSLDMDVEKKDLLDRIAHLEAENASLKKSM